MIMHKKILIVITLALFCTLEMSFSQDYTMVLSRGIVSLQVAWLDFVD